MSAGMAGAAPDAVRGVGAAPDAVRAIADAVLYEGYILWPYRRSALKNQRRFTFGGVYPPAHSERHPDDRGAITTSVLLESAGETASVQVTVRFLQIVRRQAMRRGASTFVEVDELVHDGELQLTWDEAREREVGLPALSLRQLRRGVNIPIAIAPGREWQTLGEDSALVRHWLHLRGEIRVEARPVDERAWRIEVTVVNLTTLERDAVREAALRLTFCSTHTLLRARGGRFVSLADPPPRLAGAAAACRNEGTWPALVGDPEVCDLVLSSPIILEDFPRVAPESPATCSTAARSTSY